MLSSKKTNLALEKKISTDFAIIKLLDKVINSLSKKDHIIALFIDLIAKLSILLTTKSYSTNSLTMESEDFL